MVRTGLEALIGTETATRSLAKTIAATRFLTMTASDISILLAKTGLSNSTLGVSFTLDDTRASDTARRSPVPFPLAGFDVEELADAPASLYEHVTRQIPLLIRDRALLPIALAWLDSLEPTGWAGASTEQIAVTCKVGENLAEHVLTQLQAAEPDGLFARNLRECLSLQLRAQAKLTAAMQLLLDNLPLLASGDLRGLVDKVGIPENELPGLIGRIRQLNPKPGTQFHSGIVVQAAPDLLLERNNDGEWELQRSSWLRPTIDLKSDTGKSLARELRAASVLSTMLSSRDLLVFRTAQQSVKFHTAYLDGLIPYPRPMSLADIARPLDVHETTIGRIRSHLTIGDGRHAIKLSSLFLSTAASSASREVSARELTSQIKNLLSSSAYLRNPSDETIRSSLQFQGIEISRRTVAKYRALAKCIRSDSST
jgi:RNA polymerase sigma-54 factor